MTVPVAAFFWGHAHGRDEERARRQNPENYPSGSCSEQIRRCEMSAGNSELADVEMKDGDGLVFATERKFVCTKLVNVDTGVSP